VPTAVIWGADDPFLSASNGERIKAAIPGATLDVIPRVRHFAAEEAPERCAEVVAELLGRQT
jgi:pimeloyl-ACP methyl ester carboxylesterase